MYTESPVGEPRVEMTLHGEMCPFGLGFLFSYLGKIFPCLENDAGEERAGGLADGSRKHEA